jgi:hypothetical protein
VKRRWNEKVESMVIKEDTLEEDLKKVHTSPPTEGAHSLTAQDRNERTINSRRVVVQPQLNGGMPSWRHLMKVLRQLHL